jgi:hypothetical protein
MAEPSITDRLQLLFQSRVAEPFDRRVGAALRRFQNAGREYRPIFVAGASGSGTSFLAVSLGQRFDCAGVVYEMDSQISQDSFLAVPRLDTFESVSEYQRILSPQDSWSVEDARSALLGLFRECGSGPSDVMIAKGPDINLFRTTFLARGLFPDGTLRPRLPGLGGEYRGAS